MTLPTVPRGGVAANVLNPRFINHGARSAHRHATLQFPLKSATSVSKAATSTPTVPTKSRSPARFAGMEIINRRRSLCPLIKGLDMDPNNLPASIVGQFTASYGDNYSKAYRKAEKAASNQPGASPKGSSSKASGSNAVAIPDRTNTPRPGSSGSPSQTSNPETEHDRFIAQRKKWLKAAADPHKMAAKQKTTEDSVRKALKIEMLSNFFEFEIDPKIKLMKYNIVVQEEVREPSKDQGETPGASRNYKRRVKRETKRFLINEYLTNKTLGNVPSHTKWASDYDSVIISVGSLYNGVTQYDKVMSSSSLPQENHPLGRTAPPPLTVRVDRGETLSMQPLLKHVAGDTTEETVDDLLKALNIICWKEIHQQGDLIGGRVGNKVYPKNLLKNNSEGGAGDQYVIRQGFFSSSMRAGDKSVLLNVNGVTSAFFRPMNLQKWMKIEWSAEIPTPKAFRWKLKAVQATFNLHTPSRNWIICDVSPQKAGQTTFLNNGRKVSVPDPIQDTYKPHRQDPNSFCINVGRITDAIWLPADQLTIVPWQIVTEPMVGGYAESMIKDSVRLPQENKKYIMNNGLKLLGLNPLKSFYSDFGLTLKHSPPSMVELSGIKLLAPKLLVKKDAKDVNHRPDVESGSWNLSKFTNLLIPGRVSHMAIVNFGGDIKAGLDALPKALVKYGMVRSAADFTNYGQIKVNPPPYVEDTTEGKSKDDEPNIFRVRFQNALKKTGDDLLMKKTALPPGKFLFLLVVLKERDIPFYCEVKRWTDCVLGVPSTCITQKNFNRIAAGSNLEANLCLKINFKMKGTSHTIEATGSEFHGKQYAGARDNTMVFGADVTHPPKKVLHCPSIAAVVATHEPLSCHYLSSVRLQRGKQELIADLKDMVKEHIKAWYANPANTKTLPKNILFYRDGVSDSQFGMVSYEELPQIRKACQEFAKEIGPAKLNVVKAWNPKITLVVVTKRHHARFFPIPKFETDADVNLPCGTVADNKVTTPHMWNFYLQSHHRELGTARGAHYVVIEDGVGYINFELQHITNNLCYTNQRATNVMSICTPARYADFLCIRMRCYFKPIFDGSYTIKADLDADGRPLLDENGVPTYVAAYARDTTVWNLAGCNKPWDDGLNKVMFYL